MIATVNADVATDVVTVLGESPRWDPRSERLVWLDLESPRVWSLTPSVGDSGAVDLDRRLTALGLRSGGGWVAADDSGFVLLDDFPGPVLIQYVAEPDSARARMNDGGVGPGGCFWAGSAGKRRGRGDGSLYRLTPSGNVERMLTGLGMSNGIGWSPNGAELYLIDTDAGALDEFVVDERHGIRSRRRLVTVPSELGLPDGLAVDSDGCIWVAIWGAGAVHRYTPAGRLDRVVRVAASRTTACAFGGADLATLFITTAVRGSTRDRKPLDEMGGRLFACDVKVKGLPPNMFG